jgi:hypothetical protein
MNMIVDYFLSGYWQRAFSSKTDRDLWIGCIAAACIVFTFLSLVGVTGLLAVWGGIVTDLENEASYSFFLLLATMKPWVIGFVLVFTISLSCAAYDTLQTALVATISELMYLTPKYVEVDQPFRQRRFPEQAQHLVGSCDSPLEHPCCCRCHQGTRYLRYGLCFDSNANLSLI